MNILAIETSCDETAAAVVRGARNRVTTRSNAVFSQIDIHRAFGGVVPEVAARNHIKKILPVVNEALKPLKGKKPDAIAVTVGPGLIPSLVVGIETAKSLAYAWNKPAVPVNHIAGHIYSAFLDTKQPPQFPALVLTVSGGHTELILMQGHLQFKRIGATRDDAAGEAFDKTAKLMELGYPGGPKLAQQAEQGNASAFNFPRPMLNEPGWDFSFSGLKTAVRYTLQKDVNWKKNIPNYCASIQQAIIDVLVGKTVAAATQHGVQSVVLAGGVSANTELRKQLGDALARELPDVTYHIPDFQYCTDNAAMIGAAGYFFARAGRVKPAENVTVDLEVRL